MLTAQQLRVIDLIELFGTSAGRLLDGTRGIRVRVSSPSGTVLAAINHDSLEGSAIDSPLFERRTAHSNGIYPLPSLSTHDLETTLVNLGDEP